MFVNRILPLAAASFALLCTAATAQTDDNWAGAYGGVAANLNFGWTHFALPGDHGDHLKENEDNHNSLAAGGFAGYNWQKGTTVWGLEGDLMSGNGTSGVISCAKVDGCYTPTVKHDSFTTENKLKTDMTGDLRVRLGWTDGPDTLFYVAGGYSYEKTKLSLVGLCYNPKAPATPLVFNYGRNDSLSGLNIGAGIEHTIGDNFTARVEYLYQDFGDTNFDGDGKEWNTRAIAVNNSSIRVAVAYHFN